MLPRVALATVGLLLLLPVLLSTKKYGIRYVIPTLDILVLVAAVVTAKIDHWCDGSTDPIVLFLVATNALYLV